MQFKQHQAEGKDVLLGGRRLVPEELKGHVAHRARQCVLRCNRRRPGGAFCGILGHVEVSFRLGIQCGELSGDLSSSCSGNWPTRTNTEQAVYTAADDGPLPCDSALHTFAAPPSLLVSRTPDHHLRCSNDYSRPAHRWSAQLFEFEVQLLHWSGKRQLHPKTGPSGTLVATSRPGISWFSRPGITPDSSLLNTHKNSR